MEKYYTLEQPGEITIREKEDAMGAYLMMFASIGAGLPLPVINLIAAVIYYFLNKSKSRFVHFHSLQSLLSQFPTSILNAVAVFWAARIYIFQLASFNDFFKGYLLMALVANVLYFVFSIIAAVKARRGEMYYFLFFGRLVYSMVYRIREASPAALQEVINRPPK